MRTRAMVHFILLGILCLRQYLHSLYDGALLQVLFCMICTIWPFESEVHWIWERQCEFGENTI